MAKKIVDITEKLNFDENPVLKVKNVTIEVNSDAATVLKIMGLFSKGTSAKEVLAVYELIFNEKDRKKIDKLNQADSVIFQTENQLKELGDKLPADKKAPIEAALQKLKDAHKAQDLAAIDTAMVEINTAFQAASAEMYAQGGAQQGGAQAGPDMNGGAGQQDNGTKHGDNVQDADFEEVK